MLGKCQKKNNGQHERFPLAKCRMIWASKQIITVVVIPWLK